MKRLQAQLPSLRWLDLQTTWMKENLQTRQEDHLLFDGLRLAQKGQRWRWLHPAWASTSSLRWDEANSLGPVFRRAPSAGGHSCPKEGEECTWKHEEKTHRLSEVLYKCHNSNKHGPNHYIRPSVRPSIHPSTRPRPAQVNIPEASVARQSKRHLQGLKL